MSEHSALPPSSAARRMACPGSRALESAFPSVDTDASREGTLAHEVAAEYLRTGVCPQVGGEITAEMVEGAKLYRENVLIAGFFDPGNLVIEKKIDIFNIHPLMWGTPDCWRYDEDFEKLHIYDYKFGHSYVEVFDNWQLISYAAGIISQLKESVFIVHFYIIQPRYFGVEGKVRDWRIEIHNLKPYFDCLRASEHLSMTDPAPCFVSHECKNCRARHACPTLQTAALDAIDLSRSNVPFIQEPAEVGQELRMLQRTADQLNARITGLQTVAETMLRSGQKVDNFQLKRGNSRTVWKHSPAELHVLGDLFGVDICKEVNIVTPKQAIDRGLDPSIVEAYTKSIPGALKLAPIDTKETRKLFGSK